MRFMFVVVCALFALNIFAIKCDIKGEFRCRGGRTGVVSGEGINSFTAKARARVRARVICGGRIDYVRFLERSSTC
jgi:hypothetical protein